VTDLARYPYRVTAHSAPDALEAAKAQAREEGFVVRGVGRVDAVDLLHDVWVVVLTVKPKVEVVTFPYIRGVTWNVPDGMQAGNTGPCRGCGALVLWVTTRAGKRMPLDQDGTSHFATCALADTFRKPR
jgi:hypothetical protein